jgi:uncharacterized MAPEG superfamily protein
MDIALGCIVYLYILILVPRVPAILGTYKQEGSYDIYHPREQQARLKGRAQRAQATHLNTIEAFAPFAAAIWIAYQGGTDPALRDGLALIFCGLRTLYVFAYILNWGWYRTGIWTAAALCNLALFLSPIFAG